MSLTERIPRLAAAIVVLACLAVLLVKTRPWPLISDAALMHYVVLLMQHGLAPYRDIVDINMPGSYLAELAALRVFGPGAAGWRLFDYALMAAAGVAMWDILRAKSRLAAIFAAALFAIMHIADGVAQAGERDYILAVALLAGFALLLRGLRTGSAWQFFGFGLCCGLAASIKPPALLFALLLAPAGAPAAARRRLVAAGVAGVISPLLCMGAWLIHLRSLQPFLAIALGLAPYHASLARHSLGFLLGHAVPSVLLPMVALCAALFIRARGWRDPAQRLILLAGGCGLIFFCLQGKAYPYHRYPLLAFLWLWIAEQLAPTFAGTRRSRTDAALAWAMVVFAVVWLAPASTARALRYDWRSQPTLVQLQSDLTQLSEELPSGNLPDQLDHKVQCMDTMAGCITVLDRMHLVQATGFLYDCYFFAPGASTVKRAQRQQFLTLVKRDPPWVFVVTDQWCLNLPGGYTKLRDWPEFAAYLDANYTLAQQRAWSGWNPRYTATWPFGYRLYVRHGLPDTVSLPCEAASAPGIYPQSTPCTPRRRPATP